MRALFRFLCICLLALSVPVQGLAAVQMSLLLPVAGQDQPVAENLHASCHGASTAADGGSAQQERGQHHAPLKLKACGSCCGAMLDASAVPSALPTQAGSSYLLLPAGTPPSHIPDGLERPPRRLS
jgi:hypothetical protein